MTGAASSTFLALGDSYTIGEGVAAHERWPAQLVRRLRAEGFDIGEPDLVATTGWTTDELAAAIAARSFAPPYALVSLLVGVNNQYRGRGLDEYAAQFAALLDTATALAGGDAQRVVVVSIPDWGTTPFAAASGRDVARIAFEIDAFNETARRLAAARGAHFVDVTPLSRSQPPAAQAWLVDDGLHPSAAQYAAWTERIVAAARAALTRAG
jgi:lysophospholipase L1-like esterase